MRKSVATRSGKALQRYPLTAYILLVVAYVISGKIGLMLALPPGYASAIFPASGIAIAAALIGGAGALPWIFLASLLLNLWTGYSANHSVEGIDFMAAGIIASASMLQAALGGLGLRRMIGYPTSMDTTSTLLRFFLATPIICLVSASLSVLGLQAIGVIGSGQVVESWGNWWIGDTLGVLVAFPLVLVAVGEPRALWRRRIRTVALPIVLVFVFFILAFVKVSKWEHDDSLMEFHLSSQHLVSQIETRFEEQAALLEQMDGLLRVNPHLTREQFHLFAEKSLLRFPMIQALEWVPRVESAQRAGFEAAQRKDIPGFEIRERDTSGALRRAGERSQYYAVAYVEPLIGNELARGFDLASVPRREAALLKSIETGTVIATAPVGLLQKNEQNGILLLLSLGEKHTGIGVVVLGMKDFMEKLLAVPASSMYVRFEDLDEQHILYDNFPAGMTAVAHEQQFAFGSRHYRLQTIPTPAYIALHQGWQSWWALVMGLLGTSLLGGLLLLGTGYTARVEAAVIERTRKLKESEAQNRQLAYYDFLTELPNRRLLLDRMHQALSQAKHYGRSMAIMFLDLDHFKQINDTLGHDVGDELLKTVASRLTTCIRSGDTVSRQGGDEFVIVLAEVSHAQDAALVAEKAIAVLNEPILVREHKLNITTSIGIAVYPIHGTDDVLELMKKADKAMYVAKNAGRNRYSFFPFE